MKRSPITRDVEPTRSALPLLVTGVEKGSSVSYSEIGSAVGEATALRLRRILRRRMGSVFINCGKDHETPCTKANEIP